MRNSVTKVASLGLLAGVLLLPAVPAAANTTAAGTAAVSASVQDDPFNVFKVSVKAPKKAKAGGKVTYQVKALNTGPYIADAWFLGGQFPKGVDLKRVTYRSSVKKTQCFSEGRAFLCFAPKALKKGESVSFSFYTKLTKKAKGTQTAALGVISYDVQTGMENLSKEELDRLGIPAHGYLKTVKTKIVR
ncbi:hypothetical protein AB0M50_05180 [Nonomuraea fuscirosea]|jgi:hypothetical protein|uniref:hypothetical protein n=1 Tax=Nonomuraea fuscirosea TaxID=1291556 RepID=UPI002DDBDA3C|nr:hypothetical protein [Nonomuraea fuscirosea]WSA51237.1 hypothetical protein OIE67_45515 [Nonomuraea fuscirosea]